MQKSIGRSVTAILFSVLCVPLSAQSVYLAEAGRNPFRRTTVIDGEIQIFKYTAFYKGLQPPASDIEVTFFVDTAKAAEFNAMHDTAHKMLPKGSYTLGMVTAMIPQGAVMSSPGEAQVTTKGFIRPFETYILPISAKASSEGIETDPVLSTIYYIITAVPASVAAGRKQIGSLPPDTKYIFGFGDQYLITVGNDGKLFRYRCSAGSIGKPIEVEGCENLNDADIILNFRDHHLVGLIRGIDRGQLWSFPISSDGCNVYPRDKIFGTGGYTEFCDIFPLGNNLYCRYPTGELKIYPLSDDMAWASPGVRSLGSGWGYPLLFGYDDSLIGIDEEGVVWKYLLNSDGMPGIPLRLGSGWGDYTKIAVVGNDLLALDNRHILWRIRFDNAKSRAF